MTTRVGRLVVITDTLIQPRFSAAELTELACAGGADMIQFRDKQLGDEDFVRVAREMSAICRRHGARLIINDRVQVVREAGADGLHVGRTDIPVGRARELLGADAIIGASAGSVDEAREAERAGADYVGFGHVFATSSKTKSGAPVGLEALRAACAAVKIPLIAIGGISAANAAEVMRAGAHGIAVIAAVCAAEDPRAAAAGLRTAMGRVDQ